jgi:Replication protein P
MIELRHVERIFDRLRVRYGSTKLMNAYGADDLAEVQQAWLVDLNANRITPQRIAVALEKVGAYHPSFFPNINEFIDVCRKVADQMPKDETPQIEYNGVANPELVAKASRTIAGMLNQRGGSDWALRTLDRSLREPQINGRAIECCYDALKEHGRLAEIPQAVRIKHASVNERYMSK